MGVEPSHAPSPSSPAQPSLTKPCSSSSGPHLLSCTLSLTWSREMVSWAKALLGALWGGPGARVGAGSWCVPSQGGPSLPQGGDWPTAGLSVRWLVGGERVESGAGPPLAAVDV